jgi:SAM-dependent methyltransferase
VRAGSAPIRPGADWIGEHRGVWAGKRAIREVYRGWADRLRHAGETPAPVIEIGAGPGFLKELWPDLISTDVVASPYAERVVDAAAMPFADGEIGTIVLLDVFHHLPAPATFLQEVARTLRRGGRLVMIEPWMGLAGRIFFRYLHHEDCDLRVDPRAPWGGGAKNPMDGNAALPFLYFRKNGELERMGLPLRIAAREPFAALPWLLSGGFQPYSALPESLIGAMERVDVLLSRLPALTATRCLVVVERI